jgi:hypothetical protein
MHEHIFLIFNFFNFFGLGPSQPMWAGLDPASPTRSLAQANELAEQSNTRALIHACCFTVSLIE